MFLVVICDFSYQKSEMPNVYDKVETDNMLGYWPSMFCSLHTYVNIQDNGWFLQIKNLLFSVE